MFRLKCNEDDVLPGQIDIFDEDEVLPGQIDIFDEDEDGNLEVNEELID